MGYQGTALLFCSAFLAFTSAVPPGQRHTCATSCSPASKFAYEPGWSYEYSYKVDASTEDYPDTAIDGSKAAMSIGAKAIITAIAPCEFSLKLSDVVITTGGNSDTGEFSTETQKSDLKFGFNDGEISEVCTSPNEKPWVTNFKRGILSAFQNTMTSLENEEVKKEVDVTGECETTYTVESSDGNLITVKRSKSSSSCSRLASSSHTSLPGPLQDLPLISTAHTCTQTIDHGVTKTVECYEVLNLKPVVKTSSTATRVNTLLTLINAVPASSIPDFSLTKTSLEFDGKEIEEAMAYGHLDDVESLLSELNVKSSPFVTQEVPALFTQLVEKLRLLGERQLDVLYQGKRDSPVWRYLVDAAPMVATPASTALVTKLVLNGLITATEAEVWYSSLAFVPNPTPDMFNSLPSLLHGDVPKTALLGISAMVHTYCKNDASCMEQDSLREVISAIELKLGSACRSSTLLEKEKILVALKALGNAGQLMNPSVLDLCYQERENPDEVRVAAIEAWRRAPCSYERDNLMNLFIDSSEDSEPRIAAYLSLMACPTQSLVETIKDRLISESVNHVSSFVWTHLSNLQETASQEKQWIRQLIGEDMLLSKFNSSSLKFSRNFESSFYMREQEFGVTMDSNVIFSKKSFLPRSGMMNLTVDLFGQSLNMFEVGGRMEGFEIFIEKFFGQNGYYPEETVEAIVRNMRRGRPEETTIEEMLDVVTDEPEGSYYLRVMGHDVMYHHFRGIDNFFESTPDFSLGSFLKDFLKNGKSDYTKSSKIIDTEISYSTIAGLPVKLQLTSTAIIGLKTDGHVSFNSFTDIDIDGHIYPSASIQTDAAMFIDAHTKQSGRKLSSNIHSSSFIDGKVKIEQGKVVDVSLNMPHEKTEIISYSSESFFFEGEESKKHSDYDGETQETQVCFTSTSAWLFGMQICKEASLSSTETKETLYLQKTDTHSGYSFRYLKEDNSISFLIDTPGSRTDRKFSFVGSKNNQEINVDVHTPWTSFKGHGHKIIDDDQKSIELEIVTDSVRTYHMSAGYSCTFEDGIRQFTPSLKISSPSTTLIDLQGNAKLSVAQKSISIMLDNKGTIPFTFNVQGDCSDSSKKLKAHLDAPYLTASVSGDVDHSDAFTSNLNAKYTFMRGSEHTFNQFIKLDKIYTLEELGYSKVFTQHFSQMPEWDVNTKTRFSFKTGRIEATSSISVGNGIFDLDVNNVITHAFEENSKSYDILSTVTSNSHNIDASLSEKFRLRPRHVLREARLQIWPEFVVQSETDVHYSAEEGVAKVSIEVPGFSMMHNWSYQQIGDKHYTAKVLGNIAATNWEMEGSYHDTSIAGLSREYLLACKANVGGSVSDAEVMLKAHPQEGIVVDAQVKVDREDHFIKIHATQISIDVDAKILKHMTLKGLITPEGSTRGLSLDIVWDKDVNPTKIALSGTLDDHSIHATYAWNDEIQKAVKAEWTHNSVILELTMNPSEIIKAELSYNFDDGFTLYAVLETPFNSYEKQDISFTFKTTSEDTVTMKINSTYRNEQLLGFVGTVKFNSEYRAGELDITTVLNCNSAIFSHDRITFDLKHQRNGMNIESVISGTVDGVRMVYGFAKTAVTRSEQSAEAFFQAPSMQTFTLKLDNTRNSHGNFDVSYGSEHFLKASYEIKSMPTKKFEFIVKSSLAPDMKAEVIFPNVTEFNRVFTVRAFYGTNQVASLVSKTKYIDNERVTETNLSLTLPNKVPITGIYKISLRNDSPNNMQAIAEFEMTRFWASHGTFKLHMSAKMTNSRDLSWEATVTSPDTRATLDLIFNTDGNNFNCNGKITYNGNYWQATTNGLIDFENQKISAQGTLRNDVSTILDLQLSYAKKAGTHTTKLTLEGQEFSYNIQSEISYINFDEWSNKFSFNHLNLFNKMDRTPDNSFRHTFDWKFGHWFANGAAVFDIAMIPRKESANLDANISSYWTEDIKASFKLERDGSVYKPEISIQYGAHTVDVRAVCSCLPEECSLHLNLDSTFFENIVIETIYKRTTPNALKLTFKHGDNATVVNFTGLYTNEEKFASAHISSSYLPHDIRTEISWNKTQGTETIAASLDTNTHHEVKLVYSKQHRKGAYQIHAILPFLHLRDAFMKFDYDCERLPAESNFELAWENEPKIKLNGIFNKESLTIDAMFFRQHHKLNAMWRPGNIVITNTDLVRTDRKMSEIHISYDLQEKSIEIGGSSQDISFEITGMLGDTSGSLKSKASFDTHNHEFVVEFDSEGFRTYLKYDEDIYQLKSNYHFESGRSFLKINVNTPLSEFNTGEIFFEYDLMEENSINFHLNMNEKEILNLESQVILNNFRNPQVTISMRTTFNSYERMGATLQYDILSHVKTCEAKVYLNEKDINWKLEVEQLASGSGSVTVKMNTPFTGYESLVLGLNFALSGNSVEAKLRKDQNSVSDEYFIKAMIKLPVIEAEFTSTTGSWNKVTLSANYEFVDRKVKGNLQLRINDDDISMNGEIHNFRQANPQVFLSIVTPFEYYKKIDITGNISQTSTGITLGASFTKDSENYSVLMKLMSGYKTGSVSLALTTPFDRFSSVNVIAQYIFTGDVKIASIESEVNGLRKNLAVNFQINDNHVTAKIDTPWESFILEGNMTNIRGRRNLLAKLQHGQNVYKVTGEMDLLAHYFNVDVHTPESRYGTVQVTGEQTETGYKVVADLNGIEKVVAIDYSISEQAMSLKLHTPFESFEDVLLEAHYEMIPKNYRFALKLNMDGSETHLEMTTKFDDLKGSMSLLADIPAVSQLFALDGGYDLTGIAKSILVTAKHNEYEQTLRMTLQYDSTSASVRVSVPIINEEFGAEYTFDIDTNDKTLRGTFKAIIASKPYDFSAYAKMGTDSIAVKVITPIDDWQLVELLADIDYNVKSVEGKMTVGPHTVQMQISYAINNLLLQLSTPFESLRQCKLSSIIINTPEMFKISLAGVLNEHQKNLNINYLPTETRFLIVEAQNDDDNYKLSFEYALRNKFYSFTTELENSGETSTFFVKLDLTSEDKALEVLLNYGDEKLIHLKGKLIGDMIDINFRSPFNGYRNLRTYGSLNRSKRSIEMGMMNDSGEGSLRANFRSVSLVVKSPYESIRDVTLNVQKTDDGGLQFHYKRGDVFADMTFKPTGKRKSFEVSINTAVPGWEYLALTGRLDREELLGYLSGQINEEKITIQGGGTYTRYSAADLNFTITTPYTGYEQISASFEYNFRRQLFDLEITSSGDFKIIVKTRPNVMVDIFVPNPAEPTVITARITALSGDLKISSRFEKVRSLDFEYNVAMGAAETKVDIKLMHNGEERFKLEFSYASGGTVHLQIHAKRGENQSMLHLHRTGFATIEFVFKRNGKEFKVETTNETGNLPRKGSIHAEIHNSFRRTPVDVSAHLEVDRTKSPKKVKLSMTYPGNKLYVIDVKYNIDLRNPQTGDYSIDITTPTGRSGHFNHLAGSWDLSNHEDGKIEFSDSEHTYTLTGKFGLRESSLVLTSDNFNHGPYHIDYRFYKTSQGGVRTRDYYLKVGSETKFVMSKLKGTFSLLEHGDMEYAFQCPGMRREFQLTAKWERDSVNGVTGSGTFKYGSKRGSFTLNKLKRYAETRSLVLELEASTNIEGYNTVKVEGNYNFDHQAVLNLDIDHDGEKIAIHFNIQDITAKVTRQTADLTLPGVGDVNIEFGHNFSKKKRTFHITGQLMGRESHFKADWKRNDDFTKLQGNVDIDSILLGQVEMKVNYDVRNIHDASASIDYSRNSNKFVKINWTRKYSGNVLEAEVTFESHFRTLRTASLTIHGDFNNHFVMDITANWNRKTAKVHLSVEQNNISGEITTPFEGFEKMTGSILYDFSDRKKKSVTLHYERGDRQIDLTFNLEMANRRSGSLSLSLTTPFEFARTLTLDASWKNRKGEVHYKRNDIAYSFTGAADVKADRTAFEVTFTPRTEQPVKIAFAFNTGSLISGGGTVPEKIAEVEVELLGKKIAFEIEGLRNSERVLLDVEVESSFDVLSEFEVKIDTQIGSVKKEGLFELKFNEFYYKSKWEFERKPRGFYIKYEVDSSLTRLPGAVLGFGKDGDELIFTVGIGNGREITVSVASNDRFATGFYGKISLPRRGLIDVGYEVNYSFSGEDIFNVGAKVQLEPGKDIELTAVYNSVGVKGRLSSPYTGRHSVRARRSISDHGFMADIGVDDYSISLKGDMLSSDVKRGFIIEGEVFGTKITIDTLLQADGWKNLEGKFIVHTTLRGYEKLGGLFTYSNEANVISCRGEFNLPSYVTPKLHFSADLDLNNKLQGVISMDVSGQIYALGLDLSGTLREGYIGTVTVKTPYHVASEIVARGQLKMQTFRTLYTSFQLDYPLGSKKIMISYDFLPSNIFLETRVESDRSDKYLHLKFNHGHVGVRHETHFSINGNEVTLVSDMDQPSRNRTNLVRGDCDVEISISLYTPWQSVRQSLFLMHNIPMSYLSDSFSVAATYTDDETHDFTLTVDRTDLFVVVGTVESARYGQFISKLDIDMFSATGLKAGFNLDINGSNHGFDLTLQKKSLPSMGLDPETGIAEFDIRLYSATWNNDIGYKSKLVRDIGKVTTEHYLTTSERIHKLESGYTYTSDKVILVFGIDTSYFNIGKAMLSTDVRLTDNFMRTIVRATIAEDNHVFDIRTNLKQKNGALVIKSPYFTDGTFKVDANLVGTSARDLLINGSMRVLGSTFSAKVQVNAPSLDSMGTSVEIKTPIKGYRKLNFGASYQKTGTMVNAILYADKPLGYKLELNSGYQGEEYSTSLAAITPYSGFESVSVMVKIPFHRTAPQVMVKLPSSQYGMGFEIDTSSEYEHKLAANLDLNELIYEAGIEMRNKAPYEIDYYWGIREQFHRFHIMTDSSFFSLFSLFL